MFFFWFESKHRWHNVHKKCAICDLFPHARLKPQAGPRTPPRSPGAFESWPVPRLATLADPNWRYSISPTDLPSSQFWGSTGSRAARVHEGAAPPEVTWSLLHLKKSPVHVLFAPPTPELLSPPTLAFNRHPDPIGRLHR